MGIKIDGVVELEGDFAVRQEILVDQNLAKGANNLPNLVPPKLAAEVEKGYIVSNAARDKKNRLKMSLTGGSGAADGSIIGS